MVAVPIVTCSKKHIWVTLLGHPTVQVERRYNSDVFDHVYIAQTINDDRVLVMDTKTNKVWKFEIPFNNVATCVPVSCGTRRLVILSYYSDLGVTRVKDWAKNFNWRHILYGIILLLLLWTPFTIYSEFTRQNSLYQGFELREGQIFYIDLAHTLELELKHCYVKLVKDGVSVPITTAVPQTCISPRLIFQTDGNLVLYDGNKPIWATGVINPWYRRISVDTKNKKFNYHF